MILKGSQRGGAKNLSVHLMNDQDNDHVTLYEVRGFVSRDLHGALAEIHAISKGTKCDQFMFSLSFNPPKDKDASEQDFIDAIERAEKAVGLDNQPRAIIFHEKEGRRHAHAVWSRIDASTIKAINLPHFKNRLKNLSRELYLDHGWELPDGLRRDGGRSPLNFTLDEWQQAKRLKLDPREIKQSFIEAWERSDSAMGFKHALEEKGYFLAKRDRRGFVGVDVNGEVFSVPRMIGIKTKEVKARLGDPNGLQSVDETHALIQSKVTDKMHDFMDDVDRKHAEDFARLNQQRQEIVQAHRKERAKLKAAQKERWNAETKVRSAKLNTGLRGLWDSLTGSASKIKTQNELEVWQSLKRDQEQRDGLVHAQMHDRRILQKDIERLRRKHAQNRQMLAKNVGQAMRMTVPDIEQNLQSRKQKHEITLSI